MFKTLVIGASALAVLGGAGMAAAQDYGYHDYGYHHDRYDHRYDRDHGYYYHHDRYRHHNVRRDCRWRDGERVCVTRSW